MLIEKVHAHSTERKDHEACYVGLDEKAHSQALLQPPTVLV
jgi:hypothetical protein